MSPLFSHPRNLTERIHVFLLSRLWNSSVATTGQSADRGFEAPASSSHIMVSTQQVKTNSSQESSCKNKKKETLKSRDQNKQRESSQSTFLSLKTALISPWMKACCFCCRVSLPLESHGVVWLSGRWSNCGSWGQTFLWEHNISYPSIIRPHYFCCTSWSAWFGWTGS